MPRKAGSSTTPRKKKTDTVQETAAQIAPESVPTVAAAPPEAVKTIAPEFARETIKEVPVKDAPRNGKSFAAAASSGSSATSPSNGNAFYGNIEDEIRRRAYEIYLQRAKNGQSAGDQNQDWLIAEREVRSRDTGSRTTRA